MTKKLDNYIQDVKIKSRLRSNMSQKHALYNEVKATQVASTLLKLNNESMDYLTCIKLLYSIEKEALKRWMRPVLYDELYSLPHGQVVSQTLDRAQYRARPAKSFWSGYLKTTRDNKIHLIEDCGCDKLSRAEIELIKEIYQLNKDKTPEQLMDEHHDHSLFPEWKNPGKSRILTRYSDLLLLLGKTEKQIKDFESDLEELANLEALSH